MSIHRRLLLTLIILMFSTLLLLFRSRSQIGSSRIWRDMPQVIGLGEWVAADEDEYKPELESLRKSTLNITHTNHAAYMDELGNVIAGPSRFKPGKVGTTGTNYTKAVVMSRLSSENVAWLDEADFPPEIKTYVYGVDDSSAALKTPKNKGREGMGYLTYIIDHYDSLPDVSIFLHAHRNAWHNNELLNLDAVNMIKRLSPERVIREGYMNMRCHWKPGCPEWLHPGRVHADKNTPEEGPMAEVWATLFPDDPVPAVIGTVCCAQFAVSRERIRNIPLKDFHRYRDWLLKTTLPDSLSGRVLEYLWAKMFTDQSTFCPDQRICYCDGFGVCFEDEKEFDYWFELRYEQMELQKQLIQWQKQATILMEARLDHASIEQEELYIPPVDEDVRLGKQIHALAQDLMKRRDDALIKGDDPQIRAKIAGRYWKDGDGF